MKTKTIGLMVVLAGGRPVVLVPTTAEPAKLRNARSGIRCVLEHRRFPV